MTGWRRRLRRSVASSASDEPGGRRVPQTGKREGRGVGRDAVIAVARRSPRHSSLFWFLFDQHDQLIEAKKQSGLGIPWESMLPLFAALNLTLWKGKAVTPKGARQTFLRVQKKKARLAALEAKAEAERAFQRARDPRQNMPSRFTGSFPAPLSDRQPPRVDARPLPPPPAYGGGGRERTDRHAWRTGADRAGRRNCFRPRSSRSCSRESLSICVCSLGPRILGLGSCRNWTTEQRIRVMKQHLKLRFDSWRRERGGSRSNRVDREWRKRLGKS